MKDNIFSYGFVNKNLISKLNKQILTTLAKQINRETLIVDTTWLYTPVNIRHLFNKLNQPYTNILLYSGPDSHPVGGAYFHLEKILKKAYTVYDIGNYYGSNYFSFWLEFVRINLYLYTKFNTFELSTNLKTFMCLNRKPHTHRVMLGNKLYSKNLLKKGLFSFGDCKNLKYKPKFKTPYLLQNDFKDELGNDDHNGPDEYGISNNITTLGLKENWNSHFLNIVTETVVEGPGFISEKTLKPIIGKRPFVILGDEFVYKILHSWGIDTFDDILGRGYLQEDVYKRKDWIVSTVLDLEKEKNLNKLLLDLKPRLESNYNNLKKAMADNRKKIETGLDILPCSANFSKNFSRFI